jgi:hypothetical protein
MLLVVHYCTRKCFVYEQLLGPKSLLYNFVKGFKEHVPKKTSVIFFS